MGRHAAASVEDSRRLRPLLILAAFHSLLLAGSCCGAAAAAGDYGSLYDSAKAAYKEQRWADCARLLDGALASHREHRDATVHCRSSCRRVAAAAAGSSAGSTFDDYHRLLLSILGESDCVRACKRRLYAATEGAAAAEHDVGDDGGRLAAVADEFRQRIPYDYLQLCLHKIGNNRRAAAAAFTFAAANPFHDAMAKNIEFYRSLPDVGPADFFDTEQPGHLALYKSGASAYSKGDWPAALGDMARAATLTYEALRNCSLLCEIDDDTTAPPSPGVDFVSSVADRLEKVIQCKVGCERIAWTTEDGSTKLLPTVHHYLQYINYKVADIPASCRQVGSYLLFEPSDDTMLKNKGYLLSRPGVTETSFAPLPDAQWYVHERQFLKEAILRSNVSSEGASSSSSSRLDNKPDNSRIVLSEAELGGNERFVADGIATDTQCSELMWLCKAMGNSDDERIEHESSDVPPSVNTVLGINTSLAIFLHKKGAISTYLLQLYLDLSENARKLAATYFRTKELYFDYTHLVCRTAIHESVVRDDFSHRVHSDNCHLQPDGSCPRVRPAYIQRDYSAVLYLNDDFDGGEFFFSNNQGAELVDVKPRCGRLVAFNASTFHGVKAVRRGSRCALAIWFTMDRAFDEESRFLADAYLQQVDQEGAQKDEL